MEKTLQEIAREQGFTPEHINKLLHHIASKNGRTWTHIRNVFTGKTHSAPITAVLLSGMALPESALVGRVKNKSGGVVIHNDAKPTPCRCVSCEKLYTREIFWTGTLPARVRCTECNQLLGIKDFCEVFGWVN